MPKRPALVLFRDDLRLADNPALETAAASGMPLLCVFIHDQASPGIRSLGGAARWWLHYSLVALAAGLEERGAALHVLAGPTVDLVAALAESADAGAVFWNRRYGKAEQEADAALKSALSASGRTAASFNARLLHEPWTVKTAAGTPFRVFTPFWRAARALGAPAPPRLAPKRLEGAPWRMGGHPSLTIDDLGLLPHGPDWAGGLRQAWKPGEAGATTRLAAFLDHDLDGYAIGRDRPDLHNVSALSAHLRFGETSPRQIFHAVHAAQLSGAVQDNDAEKFLAELGWREFCHHLLFQFPDLDRNNVQPRFDDFPWRTGSERDLAAWQRGLTGFPLVDAGMRQLWQTGTMHNRVRMVAASFLAKDLMIDWREGEAWFWDTLCDADAASNPANWQWVAGCGADAAPYFRIFNPVKQGETHDPAGSYVRRFVPELAALPDKWIHRPFEAPPAVLAQAGVTLGETYPVPIVDRSLSRRRALEAFAAI